MSDLKPCPFCGGEARVCNAGTHVEFVGCVDCAAMMDSENIEDLVTDWNRRAYEAELTRLRAENDALVERLRGIDRWRIAGGRSAIYRQPYPDKPHYYEWLHTGEVIRAADLERLLPVTNPDDPIHDKRQQDAEELQADRREALQELDDAVNGCDED